VRVFLLIAFMAARDSIESEPTRRGILERRAAVPNDDSGRVDSFTGRATER
jgi:hypothetical protein